MESSEWINVCETLLSGIQGYSVRLLISADEEEQSHINRTRDLCAACLRVRMRVGDISNILTMLSFGPMSGSGDCANVMS